MVFRFFISRIRITANTAIRFKQVEILKGSASTHLVVVLIVGLVNLIISKIPTNERELRFILNGTSALGLDVNGFYSQRFEKLV
jgi:iron complex outermembrane receptor protein